VSERLLLHSDSYINGEWRSGTHSQPVIDPATEAVFGHVAVTSVEDCLDAVHTATERFATWSKLAPRARSEILRRAYEFMTQDAMPLAELIVRENGKTLREARAEVSYAAEFFRWYSEEAVRLEGDYRQAPGGANWMLIRREPIGVSLLITPWNLPAAMVTRKIAPALAAGCTVVVKPASETPFTALAIAELLERSGLPPGVVNVVVPDPVGPAVEAMMESGAVRKLSFTGSTEVGRTLLGLAARQVISCSMELGGNAPFIVTATCPIEVAIEGAGTAKLLHGGAACIAANRFYVHESLVDEFTGRLAHLFGRLAVGSGLDPANDVGALVSRREQASVNGYIDSALSGGAEIVGARPDIPQRGYFVQPTVLTMPDAVDGLLDKEIFGPVAPIIPWAEEAQVVAQANNTRHGLASYVYSGDAASAIRIGEQLECGMVGINRGILSDSAAPFGGMKESGIGREGGHDGILEFVETKYMAGTW